MSSLTELTQLEIFSKTIIFYIFNLCHQIWVCGQFVKAGSCIKIGFKTEKNAFSIKFCPAIFPSPSCISQIRLKVNVGSIESGCKRAKVWPASDMNNKIIWDGRKVTNWVTIGWMTITDKHTLIWKIPPQMYGWI